MDKPKIFKGRGLTLIFEDINRLGLVPHHTGTVNNEAGKIQWDMYDWEHPYIRGLQSTSDRQTGECVFYSWAYPANS